MTPSEHAALRHAVREDPVTTALLDLLVYYEATFEQIAGLRVGDLREDTLIFLASRPGATGRFAVRLCPTVEGPLRALAEGRDAAEPLFRAPAGALRMHVADLFEGAGLDTQRPGGAECIAYLHESEHGLLRVVRDAQGLFAFNGVLLQSALLANGDPPPYVLLWTHLDAVVPANPRLLLLGGGAYVGAAWLEERFAPSRLDVVELDPRCLAVARGFFGYAPGPAVELWVGDARDYVMEAGETFDAILQDLADASGTLDWLTDSDYVRACAAKAPVLAANLILALEDPVRGRIRETLLAAGYGEPTWVPLRRREERETPQNVLMIARVQ